MPKKPTICKAAKMRRKSMELIYEAYKKQIYSFCLLLANSEEAAKEITKRSLSEAWDELKSYTPSEDEDFYNLVIKKAAVMCLEVCPVDCNAFKNIKNEALLKIDIEREKYTGNAAEGYSLYKTATAKASRENMALIILFFAGRLDYKSISKVLNIRKGVLKGVFENAAANLSRALQKVDINGARIHTPTVNQLRSFYREYAKTISFPEELDKECLLDIKKKSKFRLW
ncbi:MAG: hypothetical protein IJZ75_00305 [Clostridia bacterium]|nr:hypothetical protein [Clostridia bacterium]